MRSCWWRRCRSSAWAISPPATNWGAMLSDGLNYTYSGYWWLTYPPGIAIVLTVVAFNLVGDGLRDAFGLDTRRG